MPAAPALSPNSLTRRSFVEQALAPRRSPRGSTSTSGQGPRRAGHLRGSRSRDQDPAHVRPAGRAGGPAALGARPWLAADEPQVADTFAAFESHLQDNGAEDTKTLSILGRELTIDPATERSTDSEAYARFTREYRRRYELPRV